LSKIEIYFYTIVFNYNKKYMRIKRYYSDTISNSIVINSVFDRNATFVVFVDDKYMLNVLHDHAFIDVMYILLLNLLSRLSTNFK